MLRSRFGLLALAWPALAAATEAVASAKALPAVVETGGLTMTGAEP